MKEFTTPHSPQPLTASLKMTVHNIHAYRLVSSTDH